MVIIACCLLPAVDSSVAGFATPQSTVSGACVVNDRRPSFIVRLLSFIVPRPMSLITNCCLVVGVDVVAPMTKSSDGCDAR